MYNVHCTLTNIKDYFTVKFLGFFVYEKLLVIYLSLNLSVYLYIYPGGEDQVRAEPDGTGVQAEDGQHRERDPPRQGALQGRC